MRPPTALLIVAIRLISMPAATAAEWEAKFQRLSPYVSLAAPGGHVIRSTPSRSGGVLKTVSESASVLVAGYVETEGNRFYMSDWSYERWRDDKRPPSWIEIIGTSGAGDGPAKADGNAEGWRRLIYAYERADFRDPGREVTQTDGEKREVEKLKGLYAGGKVREAAQGALAYYAKSKQRAGGITEWLATDMGDAGVVIEQTGETEAALQLYRELFRYHMGVIHFQISKGETPAPASEATATLAGIARCLERAGDVAGAYESYDAIFQLFRDEKFSVIWSMAELKGVRYSVHQQHLQFCLRKAAWDRIDRFFGEAKATVDRENIEGYDISGFYIQCLTDVGLYGQALEVLMAWLGASPGLDVQILPELVLIHRRMGDYEKAKKFEVQAMAAETKKVKANALRWGTSEEVSPESVFFDLYAHDPKTKHDGEKHFDPADEFSPWPDLQGRSSLYGLMMPYQGWLSHLVHRGQAPGDAGRLSSLVCEYQEKIAAFGDSGSHTLWARETLFRAAALTGEKALAAKLARERLRSEVAKLRLAGSVLETEQVLKLAPRLNLFDQAANSGDPRTIAAAVLTGKGLLSESILHAIRRGSDGQANAAVLNSFHQMMGGSTGDKLASMIASDSSLAARNKDAPPDDWSRLVEAGEVAGGLEQGEALVEFAIWHRLARMGSGDADWWSAPRYLAVVITKESEPVAVDLGPVEPIDAMVRLYVETGESQGRAMTEEAFEKLLRDMHDKLVAPLVGSIGSARRITWSPDGQLHFLNFATLLNERSEFVGRRWQTSGINTGRNLLGRKAAQGDLGIKTALVIGNPAYDGPTGAEKSSELTASRAFAGNAAILASMSRSGPFDDLEGAQEEAENIGRLLKEAGFVTSTLIGGQATETELFAKAPSAGIIHLATHGVFFDNAMIGREGEEWHPMIRGCLALAGSNLTLDAWSKGRVPPPGGDGVLLAGEIASIDLRKTDLVVLSACQTASGTAESGQGVFGLRRGLELAGVRNVLLTLWSINDAATTKIMFNFYKEYLAGSTAAEALEKAQMEALVEYRKELGLRAAVYLAGPFVLTRN